KIFRLALDLSPAPGVSTFRPSVQTDVGQAIRLSRCAARRILGGPKSRLTESQPAWAGLSFAGLQPSLAERRSASLTEVRDSLALKDCLPFRGKACAGYAN